MILRRNSWLETSKFPLCWRWGVASALTLIFSSVGGCVNYLKVPQHKLLESEHVVQWQFKASPENLYQAVLAERDMDKTRTDLASSGQDRLISWVAPAQKWGDLLANASDLPKLQEGRAITSVWVAPAGASGSCLRVTRVYIGDNNSSNIGPSRGEFEVAFVGRLQKRLQEEPPQLNTKGAKQ